MSKEAIAHYEAALKEAFPRGATGDVFHHWNEARKALEKTEKQEPVAYLDEGLGVFYWPKEYKKDVSFTPLYKHIPPAQPATWVGLTDEEIERAHETTLSMYGFARAIEAKLREKNGY